MGQVLESIVHARSHALTKLPILGLGKPLQEGEFRTWTVAVRDEVGTIMCRYIMAVVADQCGAIADRVLGPG